MIHAVNIKGYRGFTNFAMRDLGQVNLLVGRNNSGKTSALEALYLLSTAGDAPAFWQLCTRRGERFIDTPDSRYGPSMEIDISHLFTGHELIVGNQFQIIATNESPERTLTVIIAEPTDREQQDRLPPLFDSATLPRLRLALNVKSSPPATSRTISLTRQGGITSDSIEAPTRRTARASQRAATLPVHFISTESLGGNELIALWDKIQLTPSEQLVLEALKFVDPAIEQIRAAATMYYGGKGGFIIKRSGVSLPFPLGTLGDGAWRMLAMAIVLTQCAGGMLFVDEIDTGFHYTVMEDMWKLIFSAAKEFNVQVFATTHSYDCVNALAAICHSNIETNSQVTIQRIEAERDSATPYSEAEIKAAAERQIEVR
jgi:hypothetical protein